MKFGVSTYSYWHFKPERVPIEHVIEEAARLELDGVEILHQQMASEANPYLQKLKRLAFIHGLDLYALSIHQGFVSPDAATRQKNINHTIHCIRLAHELGIPSIRLNSGRWGTVPSFDELMKTEGQEPALPGHTENEAFEWVIAAIENCLPDAEKYGVVLGLENHWGLTCMPEGVNRIVSAIDSDWLKVTMDCGNFLSDPYQKLEQIADEAVLVHAKTYYGGGEWYTLDLDYAKIGNILKDVGFQGYISIEFEGKADAHIGVPQSVAMLRAQLPK
ncbi:sugar phosphate isomerase/epimerase [Candidatus Poribacteria bacterium]|nr:sugar phosphate isomerase/epimerase [Candidatus Poribacteria bacterium]